MIDILISLIIAGIAGSIARSLSGFSRGGCIISIVVGFIGAIIGTWLARELQLPDPFVIVIRGTSYNILWTIIGAVIFTAVLSLITPDKKK
ncbi:MAG TPA: GlsB/YeaQ/YmgE family stress response membrane protein [Ignavibacteriaceae bacterium]|nr:GlsB/YeaQ/YmgE family stress response membrane protein [Ignavibacteriaceae bacterium]